MLAHLAEVEAEVGDWHIGERMRPILEHRLLNALDMMQVGPAIVGDAAKQNVVVTTLDNVDRVDICTYPKCSIVVCTAPWPAPKGLRSSRRWAWSQMRRASALETEIGLIFAVTYPDA